MGSIEQSTFPLESVEYEPFRESSAPRAVAVIQGVRFQITDYKVTLNAHGATDTGTVTLAASNTPDWTKFLFRSEGTQNADEPVYINIYAGFPNEPPATSATDLSQLSLRFAGIVDLYTVTMKSDRVSFQIRSLAAPMTSDKISVPFQNTTTVAFVQAMATKYGFTTNILVPTKPKTVQQVLQSEFIAGTHNMRIWDLLIQCAIWDDVDVWVDAQGVLNYAAPYLVKRVPLDIQYGRDLPDFEFTHAPQFSKNVQVEVRSYNKTVKQSTRYSVFTGSDGSVASQGQSRTVTSSPIFGTNESVTTSVDAFGNTTVTNSTKTGGATNSGLSGFASESGKEKYTFWVPSLSPSDCLDLAKKIWRQISQHEYSVRLPLPGTKAKFPNVQITALIRLHGTPYAEVNTSNSAYYQQLNNPAAVEANPANASQGGYWPRSITEGFDESAGLAWEIQAVNHTLPAGGV